MRSMIAALLLVAVMTGGGMTSDKPDLQTLRWLAGSWHGEGLGGHLEEHWTSASAGTMIGVFRLVSNDKVRVIEYIMITAESERIAYRFKHFHTNYTTWEQDAPLEFTLVECTDSKAVFHSEIPSQHSPRRITYELTDQDHLQITVESSAQNGSISDGFTLKLTRGEL